jgi:uroporphyrinogen decarboxylase
VAKVLQDFSSADAELAGHGGHVFNLGHGISQHTPPESVAVLVEAVHAQSRRMRLPGLSGPEHGLRVCP